MGYYCLDSVTYCSSSSCCRYTGYNSFSGASYTCNCSSNGEYSSTLDGGSIAGIIVASVVALIIVGVYFFCKHRRKIAEELANATGNDGDNYLDGTRNNLSTNRNNDHDQSRTIIIANPTSTTQPAYGVTQPMYQVPYQQQPVYGQPIYQQPMYNQPVYNQPVYQQPYQQPATIIVQKG